MKKEEREPMKRMIAPLVAALLGTAATGAAAQTAQTASYTLDPMHTFPSVEFSHFGVSTWKGKFTKTAGKVTLDRAARTGTVDVTIDPSSLDFGVPVMNGHARGESWFNVEKFPTITYKGQLAKFNGDVPTAVEGQLTMMGVTRPVTLQLTQFKCITHPMNKRDMCGGDATATLNRRDFNITNLPAAAVGDEIKLTLQVEGFRDQ